MAGAMDFVTGTGLLYAVKLTEAYLTAVASDGVEMGVRRASASFIQGGSSALRGTQSRRDDRRARHAGGSGTKCLLRAEQFVGRFQQVDTFNNRVKLIVDKQSGAIAVSIF